MRLNLRWLVGPGLVVRILGVLAVLALGGQACEDDSAYKSGKPLATKPTDGGAKDAVTGDATSDSVAAGGAGGMVATGGAGGAAASTDDGGSD